MAGTALSQKEIDLLIDSINTSSPIVIDTDEKAIKEYDFRRPSKINKDQLKTLELIFEAYGKLVGSYLTSYTRLPVQMEVVCAEQINFGEYANTMSKMILLSFVELKPLPGTIFMQMDNSTGDIILDRMLGGQGLPIKRKNDFSDIEKSLLEKIMTKLAGYLAEPFEAFIELSPKLTKLETNSQLTHILPTNDVIFLINIKIDINGQQGFLYFGIPYMVIESIMNRLNSKYRFDTQNRSDKKDAIKSRNLETIFVPMTAVLFKTSISLQDLTTLNVGDVIVSDNYITDEALMMVGDIPKFHCSPCIIKKHNGILIKSIISEQED